MDYVKRVPFVCKLMVGVGQDTPRGARALLLFLFHLSLVLGVCRGYLLHCSLSRVAKNTNSLSFVAILWLVLLLAEERQDAKR